MYITIDGGTTNTRVSLVDNRKIIETKKLSIGAGNCTNGNAPLKDAIRDAILTLIKDNGINDTDIKSILASGMITSEYGLCPLEHIKAPAGLKELHEAMYNIEIPEISPIPFAFVRGVKEMGGSLDATDIMRGEETEVMGIIDKGGDNAIFVLPGSHSKLIQVKSGRITSFSTMMTGEMLKALSENTILKSSVSFDGTTVIDKNLFDGYEYASKHGINEALFKCRVLHTIYKSNRDEIYSFYMGAVLCDEIKAIIASDAQRVILGGNNAIKNTMAVLLKKYSDKEIIVLNDTEVALSTVLGAIRIYENEL